MNSSNHSRVLESVLGNTKPLQYPRGKRLPFYAWSLAGLTTGDDGELRRALTALDERGMAAISTWDHRQRDHSLEEALHVGRIQTEMGLRVTINANALLYSFCDGNPNTAHISSDGEHFFDTSFSPGVKMGCPFALQTRYAEIRQRVEWFARGYRENGVAPDFVFADWEIDGALEWNGAWDASKRCARCRQNIPEIENFTAFQRSIREIRSAMQRETYARPLRQHFPDALVGNYAVYPHNGTRYWYDYFEEYVEGAPCSFDQRACYRKWFHEFTLTEYTVAMPVVYTWYPTFGWYDFHNPDYRWFYNMLLVASNAGQHAGKISGEAPLISFVHWHTTAAPEDADPETKQFSASMYQELLWHMLLRGHSTFFVWCVPEEVQKEVALAHEVYAASLEYADFLEQGEPLLFEVPSYEGPVVSAVRLGDRLLVRRTDFTPTEEQFLLTVEGLSAGPAGQGVRQDERLCARIPRAEGRCQLVQLG